MKKFKKNSGEAAYANTVKEMKMLNGGKSNYELGIKVKRGGPKLAGTKDIGIQAPPSVEGIDSNIKQLLKGFGG